MRFKGFLTIGTISVASLLLAACVDNTVSRGTSGGFKGKYQVARNALESGAYSKAIKSYKILMKESGPLTSRVRLEYAHALLRANLFEQAAHEARILSGSETGDARIAALAVQATADHEMARAAMANGARDASVKDRLIAARTAFDIVLKRGKTFDPLGALAERRRVITGEISAL